MTSRQTGRRISAMARQKRKGPGRAGRPGARRKSEPLAPREVRRLLQVVACAGVFVALVAAKLLLPARMAAFNQRLAAAMEQNIDVQAVFSAVGQALSGQGEWSMEELYQAVFRPQEEETSPQAASSEDASQEAGAATMRPFSGTLKLQDGGALQTLRQSREAARAPAEGTSEETSDGTASSLAFVLYSQENLPEGVSMEQAILGFDYSPPVKGAVLSSDFGYREHPVEGEERFHYGVDLAADAGTEVDCFADGTVTAVGDSSSYGRYCVVAHQGGYSTLYAHCSQITVPSGAEVRRGEKIAEVGQTGMATGPHLHFELQCGGGYLNPVYYVSAL